MSKYILHIGYGKTGTTSIQDYLYKNRKTLVEQKILYPDEFMFNCPMNVRNHNMLGRALAGRYGWYKMKPSDYIAQFEAQSRQIKSDKVVISAESMTGGVQPWEYNTAEKYWEAVSWSINNAAGVFRDFDVVIIIYLRRQDQWLESAVNHTIKYGGLMPERLRTMSDHELIEMYSVRMDYFRTLECWASGFGRENIKVRILDKNRVKNSGVVEDFLDAAEIEQSVLPDRKSAVAVRNRSFPRDFLEIKRVLNQIPKRKYEERVIVEYLKTLSREQSDENEKRWPLIDSETRKNIMDRFRVSNKRVACEYLQLGNQDLFGESLDMDEPESSYPGMDIEKALSILLRLDRYQRGMEGRKKMFRHIIAELFRNYIPLAHALSFKIKNAVS